MCSCKRLYSLPVLQSTVTELLTYIACIRTYKDIKTLIDTRTLKKHCALVAHAEVQKT